MFTQSDGLYIRPEKVLTASCWQEYLDDWVYGNWFDNQHLILTEVPDCKALIHSAVADHNSVVTKVPLKVQEAASHTRKILNFRDADWERLSSDIAESDWNFLHGSHPSQDAQMMTEKLLCIAEGSIPKKSVTVRKSTHP